MERRAALRRWVQATHGKSLHAILVWDTWGLFDAIAKHEAGDMPLDDLRCKADGLCEDLFNCISGFPPEEA